MSVSESLFSGQFFPMAYPRDLDQTLAPRSADSLAPCRRGWPHPRVSLSGPPLAGAAVFDRPAIRLGPAAFYAAGRWFESCPGG
jgi:hypothetical protein